MVAQREARVDSPQPTDLYSVGTLAVVHKVVKMPNQSLFVFAEGLERVKLGEFSQLTPFMRAGFTSIAEIGSDQDCGNRGIAAQCADVVPADCGWLADSVGRAFDGRHEY